MEKHGADAVVAEGCESAENFRYPYMADSITDFWRRWHITLSTWFKEYVYFPLGGSRKGKGIQIRNLLIVWGLTAGVMIPSMGPKAAVFRAAAADACLAQVSRGRPLK